MPHKDPKAYAQSERGKAARAAARARYSTGNQRNYNPEKDFGKPTRHLAYVLCTWPRFG